MSTIVLKKTQRFPKVLALSWLALAVFAFLILLQVSVFAKIPAYVALTALVICLLPAIYTLYRFIRKKAYRTFWLLGAWLLALAALVLMSFQVGLFAAISPLIAITLLPPWILLPFFLAWQKPVHSLVNTGPLVQDVSLGNFLSKPIIKGLVGTVWFTLACCSLAFLISLQKSPDAAWIQTLSTIISLPNATYLAVSILFVIPLSMLFLKTVMSWIQGETTFFPSIQPTVYDDIQQVPIDKASWEHMNFYWEAKAGIYQPVWCHDTGGRKWARRILSALASLFLVGTFVLAAYETISIAFGSTPWLSDLDTPWPLWVILGVSGLTGLVWLFFFFYRPDRIHPNQEQLTQIKVFTSNRSKEDLLQYRATVLLEQLLTQMKNRPGYDALCRGISNALTGKNKTTSYKIILDQLIKACCTLQRHMNPKTIKKLHEQIKSLLGGQDLNFLFQSFKEISYWNRFFNALGLELIDLENAHINTNFLLTQLENTRNLGSAILRNTANLVGTLLGPEDKKRLSELSLSARESPNEAMSLMDGLYETLHAALYQEKNEDKIINFSETTLAKEIYPIKKYNLLQRYMICEIVRCKLKAIDMPTENINAYVETYLCNHSHEWIKKDIQAHLEEHIPNCKVNDVLKEQILHRLQQLEPTTYNRLVSYMNKDKTTCSHTTIILQKNNLSEYNDAEVKRYVNSKKNLSKRLNAKYGHPRPLGTKTIKYSFNKKANPLGTGRAN